MYIHVSTLILARSIRGLDLTDPLYFYNILWSKTKKLFFFNCLLMLSGRFDPRSTLKNDRHIACTLSICAFSWHFNNTVQSAGIFLRTRFCFRYHAYLLDYVCCCCCCCFFGCLRFCLHFFWWMCFPSNSYFNAIKLSKMCNLTTLRAQSRTTTSGLGTPEVQIIDLCLNEQLIVIPFKEAGWSTNYPDPP